MPGGVTPQRLVWRGGLSFEGEDTWGHRVAISGESGVEGSKPSTSCLCHWRRASPTTWSRFSARNAKVSVPWR